MSSGVAHIKDADILNIPKWHLWTILPSSISTILSFHILKLFCPADISFFFISNLWLCSSFLADVNISGRKKLFRQLISNEKRSYLEATRGQKFVHLTKIYLKGYYDVCPFRHFSIIQNKHNGTSVIISYLLALF